MTRIVGRLCLPRQSHQIGVSQNGAGGGRGDIDGQLIRARERERTSQTPYKNIFKKVKKSLAMAKATDKTASDGIAIIGGNNIMKLPKCSLFSGVVAALTVTAALAPSARAVKTLEYFNFEGAVGTPGTFNSVPAPGPGGMYPFLQNSTITNVSFPAGQLALAPGQGTTLNQLVGDAPVTNTALDAMGNDTPGSGPFCFQFGANTTGFNDTLSLSFAISSVSGTTANSDPFSTLQLFYSTGGGFTQIGSDIDLSINFNTGFYTITQALPAGTLNQANLTLEFCFSGAKNSNGGAHTYLDNIVLNGSAVPEPSSYIGALVGILGVCWFQRRWLVRSLCFRRA